MDDWINQLFAALDTVLRNGGIIKWTNESGAEITTAISAEAIKTIKDNAIRLQQIGKDAFKEFLLKMSRQQDFEALVVIYSRLDNTELLQKYKEDTVRLAEIARQTQADRDFWIAFAKQVGMRMAFAALGALF